MKKSLMIWGRCGLALMAAMAFAASAAPPPTDKVHEVVLSSEYISSSKMVGKTAVGQVASTRVGAVVQPGNDIKVASCSPPTSVVDSKITTVKNCGWGKVVVGIQRGAPPVIGFDTKIAGGAGVAYTLKTTFAAGQGLRVGSPGLTGLDLLNKSSATVSATASIITPAKDLDPIFGGTLATDDGASIA